ncbi:hypothetical protein [Marinithermus hydrothermalis]|uniref:Lipoprotein n=1 Tax=Marinithermus hydrothermalis (strain DSM 14884 / JCM 11576 / T1) TaxID=869210 RepID=F2NN00_MARHT|nr:hypothetical protein [Marinithermus hydrothermalis]AEB12739.1 hypothetical protein Marky_2011 [Marinithermus hydrothermalis DSM 14884]
MKRASILGVTVPLLAACTMLFPGTMPQSAGRVPVPEAYIVNASSTIPDPPPGKIAMRLRVAYLPDPLPGEGLTFHTPDPEVNSLWAMESLESGQAVPAGAGIEGGVLFLEPGEARMITLCTATPRTMRSPSWRNPTRSTLWTRCRTLG